MTKRVLAFLMVVAMVLSLVPVTVLADNETAAVPGYAVTVQKAHNQADKQLALDIYLQANTADQGDVTGYQFTVTPAEGLTVVSVEDFTENDGIAGSGTTFVYAPTLAEPIAVGTSRVLVATVILSGETLPADVATALTLSEMTVSTEAGFYSDDAEDATAEGYAGAVTKSYLSCTCDHECEGEWKPITAAELNNGKLAAGNYYLVEDARTTKSAGVKDKDTEVNFCLNGYTWTSAVTGNFPQMINLDVDGTTWNFYDCSASGTGENLVAGKLVFTTARWGNLRCTNPNTTLTAKNIILEATEDATLSSSSDSGIGNAATFYQGQSATDSYIYAENVLIRDIHASKTVVDIRAVGEFKDVTFVNCAGGQNSASDKLAIIATNGGASSGEKALTLDGCKFIDCEGDVLDTNGKTSMTFTLKGDLQADGDFYFTNGCVANLDLGKNANVTIRSQTDKDESNLSDVIAVAEGATISAGTVIYDNAGMFVTYENGELGLSGHTHEAQTYADGTEAGHAVEGIAFKVWNDPTTLPTSGNWYLNTDVTLTAACNITENNTLNLDLNGHTITQTTAGARIYYVQAGTLNLFDCQAGYDAEGNWLGGNITGGTHASGGAICVLNSAEVAPEDADTVFRPTFNMYGGRISGNSTTSGGAVYVGYSQTMTSGKVKAGGIFNMYGGEICNNTSDTWGGAVTLMAYSHTATSGTKGADPALEIGAQMNMHGGEIYGNTCAKADTSSTSWADGTIYVARDSVMTMTDGEIHDNAAERGGAIFMNNANTKVIITGGKIYNNSAVENEGKLASLKVENGGKGGAIYIKYGQLSITDTEIYGNYSTMGGAIYASGGASTDVDLLRVHLHDNYAFDRRTSLDQTTEQYKSGSTTIWLANQEWGNGGAININNDSGATLVGTSVSMVDCLVEDNYADKVDIDGKKNGFNDYQGAGGAIYANRTSALYIEGCTFTGNYSTMESGGAIYLRNSTVADIRDSVFTENRCHVAGAAIYHLGNTTKLLLTDTTITGNTVTGALAGGVYVTSEEGRVILSGKVVIADNINSKTADGGNNQADVLFQGKSTRTRCLEVNELAEGSRVVMYFYQKDSEVSKTDTADKYVEITSDGTQTDWSCGWIQVNKSSTVNSGRSVSYVNDAFTFGHIHTDANGNAITYNMISALPSSLSSYTAVDGTYYFALSADITTTATYTVPGNVTICLNGHEVKGKDRAFTVSNTARTLTLEDCTAYTDAEGNYKAGGITLTASVGYGAVRIDNGGFIMKGGRIHDINVVTPDAGADRASLAVYVPEAATVANVQLLGGEINNVDVHQKGTNAMWAGIISYRTKAEGAVLKISDFAIRNCDIIMGNANRTGDLEGAIIRLQNATSSLDLDNVVFENNTATVTATDVTATSNSAADLFGMIYVKAGSTVTMDNTKFIGNTMSNYAVTTNGTTKTNGKTLGMLNFAASNASLTGSGNEFINNTLNGKSATGGAIYAGVTMDIDLEDTLFSGNHTDGNGGAIYTTGVNMTLTDCTFEDNTSGANGGAIYAGGSAGIYTIEGGTFTGNSAKIGGALCLNYFKTVSITGSTFTETSADTHGGALYLGGGGNTGTTAVVGGAGEDKVVFTDNTAAKTGTGYGGAIFAGRHADGSTQQYIETTIDNVECTGNDSTGGAIYLRGDAAKSSHLVKNVVLTGNTGANTSGLMVQGATNVTVQDTTITGNTSKNYGALHIATSSGNMKLEGKIVVTDNISTEYASYAENCDLYYQQYASNGVTYPAVVDMSGLGEGSRIGVHMIDSRVATDPILTEGGSAEAIQYLFANAPTRYLLAEVDGEVALAKHIDENGVVYHTVQAALEAAEAAGETVFQLQTDANSGTLTVTSMPALDLNGFDVNKLAIGNDHVLSLMDTMTNDYDVADGVYGVIKTVECAPAVDATETEAAKAAGVLNNYFEDNTNGLKRYVVVTAENGSVSAHRVYLSINSKVMRPSNNGIGFKAIFAGDQVVEEAMTAYGISITIKDTTKDANFIGGDFENGITADRTPNQSAAVVTGVLKKSNDQATNQANFETEITGTPYIVIGDVRVDGTSVTTSMHDVAKNNQSNEAVQALLETFGLTIK